MRALRPKVVVFDLDGTLYDYDRCHEVAMMQVIDFCLEQRIYDSKQSFLTDFKLSRTKVKTTLGKTAASHSRIIYFKTMIQEKQIDNPLEICEFLDSLYWGAFIGVMEPFDGARDFVKSLRQSGVIVTILTDMLVTTQIQKLKKLKMIDLFDLVMSSEEIGVEKPNVAAFNYILDHYHIKPKHAWMIGDNYERDIMGAYAANFGKVSQKINNTTAKSVLDNFTCYHQLRAKTDVWLG